MMTNEISQAVQARYGKFAEAVARAATSSCSKPAPTACCAHGQALYDESELASVPKLSRDLSRGCGNPTRFANLQPGEVVVDFGCGGGIDAILAARKVGERGKVFGVDLTPQMIERANESVAQAGLHARAIEFRRASLDNTALASACADVLISNCVINLCPDKDAVYREAFRILKPGGRLAISDIVLTEPIAADLRERFQSIWAGCTGGAIPEDDYWRTLKNAGFAEVEIVARHTLAGTELDDMAGCPGKEFAPAPASKDLDQIRGKVTSVKFTAIKPSTAQPGLGAPQASEMASDRPASSGANQPATAKTGNMLLAGGILAAIWASICCGIPLLLVTLGISGAWISTMTSFAPLRPVFVGLALVLFGFAIQRAFFSRKACVAGVVCAEPRAQRKQRIVFGSLSVVFVAIFTFPWYAPLFL